LKTFKLKGLEILENEDKQIKQQTFDLIDGLVINREDKFGWLIEAYMDAKYLPFLLEIDKEIEFMIKVKITREANDPAFFVIKMVGIDEIGENNINVIFQGQIVDQKKSRIEEMLQMIIEEGYQGESLLKKFKELI